jgi:C4-type Zn-finger protein
VTTAISKWKRTEGRATKHWIATLWCPGCDKEVSVSRAVHAVSDDGVVSPSMVCPHCPFHEFIRLEGWS